MKTPITYYGGKQKMLPHILPLIPRHALYTEAFAGGAAVFFAKEPAQVEIINDLNGELMNFYRVVVQDFDGLKRLVSITLHSRAQHQQAWHIYNHPLQHTAVQRAWALWALTKLSMLSSISATFASSKYDLRKILPLFIHNAKNRFTHDLRSRLEHTTIECDDALKVIARYDAPHTFHFADPPYVSSNMGHYRGMFNEQNLQELLELFKKITGKFMLTMFPNAMIERYASECGWTIHRVERTISAARQAHARRKQEEWIVVNYHAKNQ